MDKVDKYYVLNKGTAWTLAGKDGYILYETSELKSLLQELCNSEQTKLLERLLEKTIEAEHTGWTVSRAKLLISNELEALREKK